MPVHSDRLFTESFEVGFGFCVTFWIQPKVSSWISAVRNCPCQMWPSADLLCVYFFFCLLRRPQFKRRLFPCVKSVRPWWKKWLASWRATRQRCVSGGHCTPSSFGWDRPALKGGGKSISLPVFTTAAFLSWVGQKRCAYKLSQNSLPHFLPLPCASGGDCAWDGGGLPPVPRECQGPVQGLHRGLWPGCYWHALGGNKSWSCVCHAEMLCSQQASPATRWVMRGLWCSKWAGSPMMRCLLRTLLILPPFFSFSLPKHWCLVWFFISLLSCGETCRWLLWYLQDGGGLCRQRAREECHDSWNWSFTGKSLSLPARICQWTGKVFVQEAD